MGRSLLFIILVFFVSSVAHADDVGSTTLVYKGAPGFWFPEATATKMLQDLEELPLLRQKADLLELKVAQLEQLNLLLKSELDVSDQISAKWKLSFDEQLKVTTLQQAHYEEQLAVEKKWYKAPALWFSVGVLLTSALAIGLNYGLSETR